MAKPGAHSKRFAMLWVGAIALLMLAEVTLQTRAYLKTVRSAAALHTGEAAVAHNKKWDIKTLRPIMGIKNQAGRGGTFTTDALGRRDDPVPAQRESNDIRIAVIGASSVTGAYSKTNQDAFSVHLERALTQKFAGRPSPVLNGNVEGHVLRDGEKFLSGELLPLAPRVVIVYPDFNDMRRIYSSRAQSRDAAAPTLYAPALPDWGLTSELISKNTALLRGPLMWPTAVDPRAHFPASYAAELDTITNAGARPIPITVARASKDADQDEQRVIASTALCLCLPGLLMAPQLFNEAIVAAAKRHQIRLLDLARAMPIGTAYFVEAGHFIAKGPAYAADFIDEQLQLDRLARPATAP